jgi:hypothetical protein
MVDVIRRLKSTMAAHMSQRVLEFVAKDRNTVILNECKHYIRTKKNKKPKVENTIRELLSDVLKVPSNCPYVDLLVMCPSSISVVLTRNSIRTELTVTYRLEGHSILKCSVSRNIGKNKPIRYWGWLRDGHYTEELLRYHEFRNQYLRAHLPVTLDKAIQGFIEESDNTIKTTKRLVGEFMSVAGSSLCSKKKSIVSMQIRCRLNANQKLACDLIL